MPITRFAPAKLNLYLHVTGRRADGYHELDSLVVFLDVGDRISAQPAAALRLRVSGPGAAALTAEADNLVLRAARALASGLGRDAAADILLEKELPVAAGLGGGSSDAAATLRVLTELWGSDPGAPALAAVALGLGADVPACLHARPLRMRGIGEVLEDIPRLPGLSILLVNPGFPVATRDVFAARRGGFSSPAALPASFEGFEHLLAVLAADTRNDLEAPAVAVEARIASVLAGLGKLPGARLVRMSGSGATCFALFADHGEADRAAMELRAQQPSWWVRVAQPVDRLP